MKHDPRTSYHFLLFLIAATAVLAFFILKPFLYALILAAVFAVIFEKPHGKIVAALGGREGIAAGISTVLILVVIVAPLVLLGAQVFKEAMILYGSAQGGGQANVALEAMRSFAADRFSLDVNEYMKLGLDWITGHLGVLFSGAVRLAVSGVVFVMALYYMLKDGRALKRAFVFFSPLSDSDDEAIAHTLYRAVNSVIVGRLATALLQGVMAMAGFLAFQVPNAVLWGSLAAVTALIPGIGTALVVIPAVAYLYLEGMSFAAAGLAVWGVGFVGLVDNVVGPKLLGRGIALHPFLILLSVIGGIAFFGPIGFVTGPLAVALLFALLDAYHREMAGRV